MTIPEVQRLAARGRAALPDDVVVDVAGVLHWAGEQSIAISAVSDLVRAALDRSSRRRVWVCAPPAVTSPHVTTAALSAEGARMVGLGETVVRSAQPLTAMLNPNTSFDISPFRFVLVTAGLEDRLYELYVLDWINGVVLDIGSGRVCSYLSAYRDKVEPIKTPELVAIVGEGGAGKAVSKDATSYETKKKIREALWDDKPPSSVVLPRLAKALADTAVQRAGQEQDLRGEQYPPDPSACAELETWLKASPSYIARVSSAGVYILPQMARSPAGVTLVDLDVSVDGVRVSVAGPRDERSLVGILRDLPTDARWFVPHALDLLDWMVDHGLPLPKRVVDPALVLFASGPSAPPAIDHVSMTAATLAPEVVDWLQDWERNRDVPLSLNQATGLLPQIDRELRDYAKARGVEELVEEDLACTLPVLAQIERQGAWVRIPPGVDMTAEMQRTLAQLGPLFLPLTEFLHPYDDELSLINRRMRSVMGIAPGYLPPWPKPDAVFERYVDAGLVPAVALAHARSIAANRGSLAWAKTLEESGGRLRGQLVPQASGRFGFRGHDLQNLPKRSEEGRMLRGALGGPEGYVLLDADFDGFEARIIAGLSGDPNLMASALTQDIHRANASLLFGSAAHRGLAKDAFLAIAYEQTAEGFHRAHAGLHVDEARAHYKTVTTAFPGITAYRQKLLAMRKGSDSVNLCGWRVEATGTKLFNNVVQSFAAALFRRVLRELHARLPPLGAFVLHQVHDEVVVAALPGAADEVTDIMVAVMTNAAMVPTPLLPHHVPFFVRTKKGSTWADFA